jgi:tetratricopeptide (TPR) repeat protein
VLKRGQNPDALVERARIYLERGEYPKAIADLTELVTLAPDAYGLRFMRARAQEKLREFELAIYDLKRVVESMERQASDPTAGVDDEARFQVNMRLAECLAAAGRNEESVKVYSDVIKLQPKSLTALVGRGRALRKLKTFPQAMADFDEAARLWPARPEPLIERAIVHAMEGRKDLAARDKSAATAIDRRVVEAVVAEVRATQPAAPATPKTATPAAAPAASASPAGADQPTAAQVKGPAA